MPSVQMTGPTIVVRPHPDAVEVALRRAGETQEQVLYLAVRKPTDAPIVAAIAYDLLNWFVGLHTPDTTDEELAADEQRANNPAA